MGIGRRADRAQRGGSAAYIDLLHRLAAIGRYGFGVSLPVFGALHFIYHDYVASVIPAWVPGSPVFWTYFTGCAHIAVGIAILAGVQAQLAARLLGSMFGSWVLIVHVPRVLARPASQAEWTSLYRGHRADRWCVADGGPFRALPC